MTLPFGKLAGKLAALALLGAALFPSNSAGDCLLLHSNPAVRAAALDEEACEDGEAGGFADEVPQGTVEKEQAHRDRRLISSWTLSSVHGFEVVTVDDGARGELYLDTPDSGGLRLQAVNLEPLPPVSVDNGPFHLRVDGHSARTPSLPVNELPPQQPRARLTGVHVFRDRPSPPTTSRNGLSFSFRGKDQGAQLNRFRYRLAGLDLNWRETNRCSVRYPDLRPGLYTFEVLAANQAGLWSEPATMNLQVIAPWWRRPEVVTLAAVGLALFAGLFAAARARRLLQVERLRTTIAADLHDQIGAGLTDIAILSEVAALKAGDLPELSRVAMTARELVDGMGDIVWLVNPRRDSLYELFLRLKDSYAELFAYAGAQLEVGDLSAFEGARLPMTYRQDLHLLFKEALRNALRHSGCRQAGLSVSLRRRSLAVELRDDGRGFDPTHRNGGGEGLESMHRRATRLGGQLIVDSSPAGTVVRFVGKLP